MAEPSEGSGLRKLQLQQDDDDDYYYGYDDGDVAFSHNNSPPPYCDAVACGGTYTGKVFLNGDLYCDGGDLGLGDGTVQDPNCAVTLDGSDAELDCKGYSLYQDPLFRQRATDCTYKLGSPEKIEAMKRNCGMYFVRGVCVKNGATLKNCGVQKFYEGVFVKNSGTIEHSTMKENTIGLQVNDDQADDKTEVSYT